MLDKNIFLDSVKSSVILETIELKREIPKVNPFMYLILVLLILFLILIPSIEVGYNFSVASGVKPVITPVLKSGHLYKLVIEGVRDPYNISDCLLKSNDGRYNSIATFLSINNKNIMPDLSYPYSHKYIYYIPGNDRSVVVDIASSVAENLLGNRGEAGTLLSIDEANFKLWVDTEPLLQSERILFNYSLDPIPRSKDEVIMAVYDGKNKPVFRISNRDIAGNEYGDPDSLTGMEMNHYVWYGIGNIGEWSGKLLPHGGYLVQLLFKRGQDEFYAFCPGKSGDDLNIAITRRLSGDFPDVIQRTSSVGSLFPYTTYRALKTVASFPDGIEGIYSKKAGVGDDFLYYENRSPLSSWLFYPSEAVILIQRTLNLIRSSYWEFYGLPGSYPDLIDISGEYDINTARMVEWFRKKFSVSSAKEIEILQRYDNLPPDYDQIPTESQLSYIIAGDTLKGMLDTSFKVRGIPSVITLADLDNLPAYNPDDRYHSLYHLFEEIGKRTISERKHSVIKAGEEPKKDTIYDISDDGFVSMMIAICYQESGISHVTESGRIYRAGTGRGSATGYMQLTADVITYPNFVLTFPTDTVLKSVKLGSFSFADRYALRNINRSNFEIGAQFLKEMWYNIESERFNKRFREEIKAGGLLSACDKDGFIKRVKLAAASYNAGPEAVKVMIEYPYDNPDTKGNESVDIFFNDYGGDLEPYLKKFRDDIEMRAKGNFHFPIEKSEKGREIIEKLIKWLGPFWHEKFTGISWDEAALMKLDKEVLGYIKNVSTNTMRLISPEVRERVFKDWAFNLLIVKKEEEKTGEEKNKEQDNVTIPPVIKPESSMPLLKE
jgi:hypothetical protein